MFVEFLTQWDVQRGAAIATIDIIPRDSVLEGLKSGRNRSQGWATKRRSHITATEQQTPPGELVEVGRLNRRMSHVPVVGPRLVITEDQNDIRLSGVGSENRGA